MMNLKIQQATRQDFTATEHLTREAFWNLYKPGCEEHLVLHKLRKSNAYIPELDLIALQDNIIVGQAISTRARVIGDSNQEKEILCLGPICTAPELQNRGIGSMLMNRSIATAWELGYPGIVLFGNPDYYHRFGFKNAQEYGINTKDGQNFEPFMVLELQQKGLRSVKGRFFEDKAFTIDEEELVEFEKQFPYKEKLKTDSQLNE